MQIQIPDAGLIGKALDPDFAFVSRPQFARPHYLKLGFAALVLHVDDLTRLYLATQPLDHSPGATDVPYSGQLHERAAIVIHAPDSHW